MQLVSAFVSFTVLTLQGSSAVQFWCWKMLWMTDFSAEFLKRTPASGVAAVSSQKVASVMNSRD